MEFTGNIFGYAFSVVSAMAQYHLDYSQLNPPQWTDYACSFIDSDFSWRLPLFIQCIIGSILAGGSLLMPESPRYVGIPDWHYGILLTAFGRWLIDTDRDDEGMRVIADLHGGDPNNPIALDEYQEIKDRVVAEVISSFVVYDAWFADGDIARVGGS